MGDDLNDQETVQELEHFRAATQTMAARIAFLLGPEARAFWRSAFVAGDIDAESRADDWPGGRNRRWLQQRSMEAVVDMFDARKGMFCLGGNGRLRKAIPDVMRIVAAVLLAASFTGLASAAPPVTRWHIALRGVAVRSVGGQQPSEQESERNPQYQTDDESQPQEAIDARGRCFGPLPVPFSGGPAWHAACRSTEACRARSKRSIASRPSAPAFHCEARPVRNETAVMAKAAKAGLFAWHEI